MDREKYKLATIAFLGNEGIQYLKEYQEQDKLILAWGSVLYGAIGMQVRNYLRSQYPEIDAEFPNYGAFEDFSYNLIQEILKDYE